MKKKQIDDDAVLVVGLGRFGTAIASTLDGLGREVLAIERDPVLVQQWSHRFRIIEGDATSADALEQAGAAMILLECVPSELAAEISQAVKIPVIGIGAGSDTDGQVLVLHDMLGLSITGRVPKFVKNFMQGQDSIQSALKAYVNEVKGVTFPGLEHGFSA